MLSMRRAFPFRQRAQLWQSDSQSAQRSGSGCGARRKADRSEKLAVKSSRAVFEVLQVISRADTPLGAAEIAKALSLPLTTAVRALNTLEAAGYALRRGGSARFVLGQSGQRLAYAFMSHFPVRDLALPYLQQLTLISGSSSSLFVRLGWYSLRIALIAGTSSIVNVGAIGEARALTVGAPSLAMLAQLPDNEFVRAVEHGGGDEARLRKLCTQVRKQGYALDVSAIESGGYELAFPLSDLTRSILASVALEGFATNLATSRDQIEQAGKLLRPLQDVLTHGPDSSTAHYEHIDPDAIQLG
jgi:IclR family transcriptional regulator, KDG regulon repressor